MISYYFVRAPKARVYQWQQLRLAMQVSDLFKNHEPFDLIDVGVVKKTGKPVIVAWRYSTKGSAPCVVVQGDAEDADYLPRGVRFTLRPLSKIEKELAHSAMP